MRLPRTIAATMLAATVVYLAVGCAVGCAGNAPPYDIRKPNDIAVTDAGTIPTESTPAPVGSADTRAAADLVREYPPPSECQTEDEGTFRRYEDGAVEILDNGCVLDAETREWRTTRAPTINDTTGPTTARVQCPPDYTAEDSCRLSADFNVRDGLAPGWDVAAVPATP